MAAAGTAFSTHSWRAAAAGHLWGWQITRCLYLLVVLTGAIGEPGGVNLHATNKFVPKHPNPPPAPDYWNELLFPKEFPLAFFEMSFLLPHFLKEGRGRLDTYFTRVYNPLWTNPDGFTWMEVLQDESKIGMHVALTPIWSETAWFADYILPMGLGTERHDTMSQETHAGRWLGFRQPVTRVAMEKQRREGRRHARSQSRRSLGRDRVLDRALVEDRSGRLARHPQVLRVAVPARRKDHGRRVLRLDLRELGPRPAGSRGEGRPHAAAVHAQVRRLQGRRRRVQQGARAGRRTRTRPACVDRRHRGRAGFNTPSRKLEFYSPTLAEWGWPEHAIPRYVPGHVYWRDLDRAANEFDLLPNFRLPTLIHTRSPVKWLYEISHNNPLWIATGDAAKLGIEQGDLVKVQDRHRPLRHARLGHRGHPARRRRHVAPPRPMAAQRRSGRRARRDVTREDQRDRTAATRCGRSTARSRSRATIRTARASGGARSACTRTSRSRCSPIR